MKLVSISSETKNLLDKLYNLRGNESTILVRISGEKDEAIATQERTKKEKATLLEEIDRLTQDEAVLAEQGNKLMAVLGNINRNDFSIVLERLNIDFNPADLNAQVNKLLPETIDGVVTENKRAAEKLSEVEAEMSNAVTKIEELEIRRTEALENQAKLNEYLDLALSGSINITRDALTNLLEKMEFNENEQREAAKIMMFPEDALYEYDARVKSGERFTGKSISEVLAEAKGSVEEKSAEVKKVEAKEEKKEEAVVDEKAKQKVPELELEEIFDEIVTKEGTKADAKVEEGNENQKIEALLSEVGLDAKAFDAETLKKITEKCDDKVLRENVEALKKNKIDLGIVVDNYEILSDKELKSKLEKLLEIGKESDDIGMMPSVLVKYDLNGLNNVINVLQISGLDPKKVPLMAY